MQGKAEVLEAVVAILAQEFSLPVAEIRPDSLLGDDLDLDSIDAIDLAVHVEEEHGILLGEDDLKSLRTVQDVVDVLDRKTEAGARGAA